MAAQLEPVILASNSFDPWTNLSLEEYWIDNSSAGEIILFLWQNDHTVVIGRNQNAWKECRWKVLENDGGRLARRLSGGGAVYHDRGNLNFSFIVPKEHYSLPRQLGVILRAVRTLGLPAEFSGRNDLLIGGQKFSGNSFYFDGDKALHHGTLLVSTDLSRLSRYLNVSAAKMNSKGIKSVQSRVVNLADLDETITVKGLADRIRDQFHQEYGLPDLPAATEKIITSTDYYLDTYIRKHVSWDWRFGKSPAFDVEWETRFEWGEIAIGLELHQGRILTATVYSDALEEDLIRQIEAHLQGSAYSRDDLTARIKRSSDQSEHQVIIEDICGWVKAVM